MWFLIFFLFRLLLKNVRPIFENPIGTNLCLNFFSVTEKTTEKFKNSKSKSLTFMSNITHAYLLHITSHQAVASKKRTRFDSDAEHWTPVYSVIKSTFLFLPFLSLESKRIESDRKRKEKIPSSSLLFYFFLIITTHDHDAHSW